VASVIPATAVREATRSARWTPPSRAICPEATRAMAQPPVVCVCGQRASSAASRAARQAGRHDIVGERWSRMVTGARKRELRYRRVHSGVLCDSQR
jgi:hypothetical protein